MWNYFIATAPSAGQRYVLSANHLNEIIVLCVLIFEEFARVKLFFFPSFLFFSQQKDFVGLSFPTISSVGPNGAIIHYRSVS